MGLYSPVNSNPQTLQLVDQRRYLNRALLVFTAEDPAFEAAFIAAATVTNSKGETISTGGLVKELDINTYLGFLDAAGAPDAEPIRNALVAHFTQRAYADANGIRASITRPDKVYIGRRTTSAQTSYTYDVTGGVDGDYTLTISLYGVDANNVPLGVRTFTHTAVAETPTQIRDALILLALADADVVAAATVVAGGGAGEIDIDTIADGKPLIVGGSSTGSPVTVVENTLAGSWSADYDAMVQAAEIDGAQERLWYWVHDIQIADVVELAIALHIKNLADPGVTPVPRKYRHASQSHDPLNFDPLSAGASYVEVMLAAGYDRSHIIHKALPEFAQSAWLGRCIGFFPGQIGFSNKELFGSATAGQMTKEDYGADEGLAQTRRFAWYASVTVNGLTTKAYAPAQGRWVETGWLEDYLQVVFNEGVTNLLALKDITTYTDADIKAIRKAGEDAVVAVPLGVIDVSGDIKLRREVDPQNIVLRVYLDLVLRVVVGGQIIQVGTLQDPVPLLIQEF